MSNKSVLLEKYRLSREVGDLCAPLDYIQLRNQEALREWRSKMARVSSSVSNANPMPRASGFSQWIRV